MAESYQTILNPVRHSKSSLMRLTLMVLSILRVLPVTRTAFIALFLALFLTAASTRSQAVQVHEHKKTVPIDRPHRKSHTVPPRSAHRSSVRAHHTATRYSAARHKTP